MDYTSIKFDGSGLFVRVDSNTGQNILAKDIVFS